MKAEELMIGDLVCYNKANNWITKVEAVGNPGQTYISDVYDIKCYRHKDDPLYEKAPIDFFNVDILHPIPLTDELLVQNGFELLRDTWYFSQNGRPVLIRFADNYIVIIINGDHVPMKLRYVHELQHALRLCGIEKEIIIKKED